MRTHSTFTPSSAPPDTTDRDPLSVAERRYSAWVDIAEGMLQGCPAPADFRVHDDASIAALTVREAGHVVAWAAFLGLSTPRISSRIPAATPSYRLTVTTTAGERAGVYWLVDHFHRERMTGALLRAAVEHPAGGEPGA